MKLYISLAANTYGPLPDKLKALLSKLCQEYWPKIPMDKIWSSCEDCRFNLLDEDGEPWEGILTGREGRCTIDLGDKHTGTVVNALHLQWHKMASGKYEINAYLDT